MIFGFRSETCRRRWNCGSRDEIPADCRRADLHPALEHGDFQPTRSQIGRGGEAIVAPPITMTSGIRFGYLSVKKRSLCKPGRNTVAIIIYGHSRGASISHL